MIYSQLEETTAQRLETGTTCTGMEFDEVLLCGLINLWHPAAYIRASVSAPNEKPKKVQIFT